MSAVDIEIVQRELQKLRRLIQRTQRALDIPIETFARAVSAE